MTDIKEAQGLEVSVYTDQHGTAIRADILRHTQIEADGLEPHCRLSDATAVIDQQARRIELLDEDNRQLRERVASLESRTCRTCDGHGLIGGFINAESGYDSQPCPDCNTPVVMPERKKLPELMMATYHESHGWNACLDEFDRLNRSKT